MCSLLSYKEISRAILFPIVFFIFYFVRLIASQADCCCEKQTPPQRAELLSTNVPSNLNSVTFQTKLDATWSEINTVTSAHLDDGAFWCHTHTSTLSSFRSRWVIPRLCRKATALHSCCTTLWLRWASGGLESRYWFKSPPSRATGPSSAAAQSALPPSGPVSSWLCFEAFEGLWNQMHLIHPCNGDELWPAQDAIRHA